MLCEKCILASVVWWTIPWNLEIVLKNKIQKKVADVHLSGRISDLLSATQVLFQMTLALVWLYFLPIPDWYHFLRNSHKIGVAFQEISFWFKTEARAPFRLRECGLRWRSRKRYRHFFFKLDPKLDKDECVILPSIHQTAWSLWNPLLLLFQKSWNASTKKNIRNT